MASEEFMEEDDEEEEEEEEPSLLDVISSYRHDADKIIILARSIETILHYTERLEENAITINNYVQYMYEQLNGVMTKVSELESRFKKLVEFQMEHIQQVASSSTSSLSTSSEQELRNEITSMGSQIIDLQSTISSLKAQMEGVKQTARAVPIAGVPPTPPSPQGTVVEESLLKPSSFQTSTSTSPAPKGPGPMGGMSVRMAMMSEIKSRLGKRSGAPVDLVGGAGGPETPVKTEYVPKIHQPREAKPISSNLTSKMNELLDRKFQMQMGGNVPQGTGPPSAGTPSAGPPKGPPKAPPSAGTPQETPSTLDTVLSAINTEEDKEDKKKEKKKDKKKDKDKDKKKKDKDIIADRLASIDAALQDKLG